MFRPDVDGWDCSTGSRDESPDKSFPAVCRLVPQRWASKRLISYVFLCVISHAGFCSGIALPCFAWRSDSFATLRKQISHMQLEGNSDYIPAWFIMNLKFRNRNCKLSDSEAAITIPSLPLDFDLRLERSYRDLSDSAIPIYSRVYMHTSGRRFREFWHSAFGNGQRNEWKSRWAGSLWS